MGFGPGMYEIRVQGKLGADWSDWFGGMEILLGVEGETIMSGIVQDQAALHGLLARVRDLNLILVSVKLVGGRPSDGDRD